jgi:hypothetical protein
VEVAFERPWSWARGLDAFHMMRHRKDGRPGRVTEKPRSEPNYRLSVPGAGAQSVK